MNKVAAGRITTIGCLGLAYKPDVDDLLESPAVEIVEYLSKELHLTSRPFEIRVVEPHIKELPAELREAKGVRLTELETALDSDLVVMLVNHAAFSELPYSFLEGKEMHRYARRLAPHEDDRAQPAEG